MRARWPRSLVAMFLAASAGALGAAALVAGPAQAANDVACGQLGHPACKPTATISSTTSETDGTITIVWTSNSPGLTVSAGTPNIAWSQQASTPANAPQPTFASVPLAEASCVPGAQVLTCTYQWPPDMLVGGYVLNGTYTVNAGADDCVVAGVGCVSHGTASQSVAVANPPTAPTAVKAEPGPDPGTVKISWAPNPEPDVVGYQVFRSDGAFACPALSTLPPPPTYSCVDSPPKDGQYAYHVVAYRWGAVYSTSVHQQAASGPSGTTKPVTVVGTSAHTTTTVAGGGSGTLGPAGFTAKPAPNKTAAAGGTGTGAFHGSPGGATASPGVDTPASGDPGFQPTLPYGQKPQAPTSSDPSSLAAPAAPHKGKTSVGTIAVVGAGLLIAVIALHGLWLRSEVRRTGTLEAIEPEA